MTDLTTRIAVAIHGGTPPNPDAALALHQAQAERVVAALGDEGLRKAAAELLALKDGPRDVEYRLRKPYAWAALRAALPTAEEPGA